MRREFDALLSAQRFIAAALPEPWDVRTDLETGEPPERPFALVELVGPGLTTGGPAMQDRTLPLVASLYLAKADTRAAATDAALEVREAMWQAVRWGSDPARPTTDRIPLYSYVPRLERHRFKVVATGGTFRVDSGAGWTDDLPFDVTAGDLAAAIVATFTLGGTTLTEGGDPLVTQDDDPLDPGITPGSVTVTARGIGLWDVEYGGDLAGIPLSGVLLSEGGDLLVTEDGDLLDTVPAIDGSLLEGPRVAATATVLLMGAAAPWRTASDYLRVDSFTQTTIRDPVDPSLVMVAADLRLTFGRGLPVPSAQRILQRIGANGGG